ncbi:protein of unknown function [Candidatus Nitrosocosmicus franklandus]|uniref:Uncharacterized protein n=1 Tax=Candidatus Nitrosocosmicus franklandianus TaxID=1798806 RepID=A0A484IAY2_9ARCH|nr:protein of unknown function [Candidatus Nitrosocosmicus franklandus]
MPKSCLSVVRNNNVNKSQFVILIVFFELVSRAKTKFKIKV